MGRTRIAASAFLCFFLAATAAVAAAPDDDGSVSFTASEKALIAAQGPWPAATAPDPSNRVSGNADAIRFGRVLFESTALSAGRDHACASCHRPDRHFTDGRVRGRAIADVDRNTPALHDLRRHRWFGWGGRSDSLWMQSLLPILDPRELGLTPGRLRARIVADPTFNARYRETFGEAPDVLPPERVLVDTGKALAAYLETLVSPRSAFDDFRDALIANDAVGIAVYPLAAKRGLKLFLGKGNCIRCHFGPAFTSGEFNDTGLPDLARNGRFDEGRYGDIALLKRSRFNLLGPYNDDPARRTAGFTARLQRDPSQWEAFRVPSLRGVAHTAPYMHDGSLKTLVDVVRHYSEIDPDRLPGTGEKILEPLHLTDAEIADVVAFLKTL